MELIKKDDRWDLYNEDGHKIASTLDGCVNKLSLKNCQAIENGYDLDELAKKACPDVISSANSAYKAGFQKALEILGDKKSVVKEFLDTWFDVNDTLIGDPVWVDSQGLQVITPKQLNNLYQKTEWEVEIVGSGNIYKTVLDCCPNYHPKFGCSKKDNCSCKNNELPKLDADGCIVLKRK